MLVSEDFLHSLDKLVPAFEMAEAIVMSPVPSPDMVQHFLSRTRLHIERVRKCMEIMARHTEYSDELRERGLLHDASKFTPAEREPYIWLTHYHLCRQTGEPFQYPPGVADMVSTAIQHHVTTNRHHPEFHSHPDDMTPVDLIEMVCDWTAMSQELGQDSGSARGWADKTIGSRLLLNSDNRRFVYEMIDLLDCQLRTMPGN